MADINKLKDKIKSTIYPNGKGAINASDHQAMLLDMADGMAETDTKLAELSEGIVKNMLLSEAFTVQSCTRDKYGDINSALITWADGVDGKIDIARNSDGTPNRIDMKYGTKWYILTIIRDGNGDVISSTLK